MRKVYLVLYKQGLRLEVVGMVLEMFFAIRTKAVLNTSYVYST